MDSEPTWLAIAAGLGLPKEKKGKAKLRTKKKIEIENLYWFCYIEKQWLLAADLEFLSWKHLSQDIAKSRHIDCERWNIAELI